MHFAAVQLYEIAGDRQPEADAAMLRAEAAALEPLEDAVLQVPRNADALILDREHDAAILTPAGDPDGIPRPGEADRVRQQIVDDLTHAALVGGERDGIVSNGDVEGQPGPARPFPNSEDGGVEHVAHIQLRELQLHSASLDGGEVENVVDD